MIPQCENCGREIHDQEHEVWRGIHIWCWHCANFVDASAEDAEPVEFREAAE